MKIMTNSKNISKIAAALLLTASFASASTIVSFLDTGVFDQASLGAFDTFTDGANSFTVTTIDIIGTNGASVLTGGQTHLTSVAGAANVFGINSTGSEIASTGFDSGEAWVASFSEKVTFDSIEISSLGSGDSISLIFEDGATISLAVNGVNAIGQTLEAGKTFTVQTGATSGSVTLNQFTVSVIPEPSAYAAIFGMAAVGLVALRRRSR